MMLSSHQRRPLGIECPAGNKILHGHGIVALGDIQALVERMRFVKLGHIQFDAVSFSYLYSVAMTLVAVRSSLRF